MARNPRLTKRGKNNDSKVQKNQKKGAGNYLDSSAVASHPAFPTPSRRRWISCPSVGTNMKERGFRGMGKWGSPGNRAKKKMHVLCFFFKIDQTCP